MHDAKKSSMGSDLTPVGLMRVKSGSQSGDWLLVNNLIFIFATDQLET